MEEDFSSDEDANVTGNKRKLTSSEKKQNRKRIKKELYKPPTAEELRQLKETENLFNSNLFRLQIEELLNEVSVKNKHKTKFDNWFKEFNGFVENLKEHEEIKLSEIQDKNNKKLAKQKRKLVNYFQMFDTELIKYDQDVILKFPKPNKCSVIGFHNVNSAIGPQLNVKINLEMPKKMFHEKDFMNNRYFAKRYFYLLYIAKAIQSTELASKITFSFVNGSELLPIIEITPRTSKNINIKIFVMPEKYFKENRFLPEKNNVKIDGLFTEFENINEESLKNTGTVLYNSLLLHDITLKENHEYFKDKLNELKNVQDALKLLQVWVVQRQLNHLQGYPDDFLLYSIVYLLSKRKVNKHMSSYQIIRNFWTFLNETDLSKDCVAVCEDVKPEVFEEFHKNFDVVLLDKSGCYNVTAFLNLEGYKKIKSEAEQAVQYLDENRSNSFDALFITKVPFLLQYDLVLRFESTENFGSVHDLTSEDEKYKFIGFHKQLVTKTIISVLKKGLNKRIKHIAPHNTEFPSFEVGKPWKNTFDKITFGISLDVEHAFNVMELGPHPHDPKVKEFINFWGELTNLRRFPDGTTCEAVYFETKSIKDRRDIIKKIIDYLATEKLKLTHDLYFNQFEKVILCDYKTNEENCLKIIAVSEDLSKKLRALALPLDISTIMGNSDIFSYTDLFPPSPMFHKHNKQLTVSGNNVIFRDQDLTFVPTYLQPIECVLQLSLHSKWPNNLEAIRCIKAAFYLKIAELFKKQFQIKCSVKSEFLDVFYQGYVFRYSIYHPKEAIFLKKHVNPDGLVVYKDTPESICLEMSLNISPKLNSALRGVQLQHPSYGPSTTLIKRWLRSQLIDGHHISDAVINMLNASLFLNSAPFAPALLPQVAFFRFLKFVSEADWNLQPVVVNFNEDMPKDTLEEIEANFHQNRSNYPNLFIIMPYDEGKSLYTRKSPSKEVLNRISLLAAATYKILCSSISTSQFLHNVQPLFTPNLEGYNLIIHLKPSMNSRRKQKLSLSGIVTENFELNERSPIPIAGFSPVDLYLKELRASYDNFAVFFHDSYGGDKIGVIWKLNVLENKDFKIVNANGCRLDNGNLVLNVDAIIDDFCLLGKDLIEKVERK